jgi:hypothetical protein
MRTLPKQWLEQEEAELSAGPIPVTPIYLLGFFSKYECWVTDLIMPLYHFIFFGLSLAFVYHEISITTNCD